MEKKLYVADEFSEPQLLLSSLEKENQSLMLVPLPSNVTDATFNPRLYNSKITYIIIQNKERLNMHSQCVQF